jgi:hypothetical protein
LRVISLVLVCAGFVGARIAYVEGRDYGADWSDAAFLGAILVFGLGVLIEWLARRGGRR